MENNKNFNIAFVILLIIAVLISVLSLAAMLTLSVRMNSLAVGTDRINQSVSRLAETKTDDDSFFVLREYEGKIGVFDDCGVLTEVIDVNIKSLPEADRSMLRTGIYALSRNELISLIEDYTG